MADVENIPRFSLADLDRWVARGLIQPDQARALREDLGVASPGAAAEGRPPARQAGLSLVTIAYYFGAFMILLAYTIFVGLQWDGMGWGGQLAVACGTVAVLLGIGAVLRRAGYLLGGNLLVFAGVGVVPLAAYTILRAAGWWPDSAGADEYRDFYRTINGNWLAVEIASIAAAAVAAWWIRFPLLTLLIGFWGWYLSMDLTRAVVGTDDAWDRPEWIVGAFVGAVMVAVGVVLQRRSGDRDWSPWLYGFGHAVALGNLGALALDDGGWLGLLFFAIYLGVVVASVWLQSRIFLAFGALGCYAYVAKLAFDTFGGSLGFTFGLALAGLLVVLSAVGYQRYARPWLERRFGVAGTPGAAT